jgi:transposase InsO family protein
LRVPQRRKKKRLTGIGVAVGAMSPIRPNVIWAMDFQFDTTADGRPMKMLNVIDEFTREALAIEVDRSIDADGVVDVLDRLALTHGAPHYVRFDNGPEFVAHAVSDWCRFNSADPLSSIPARRGRTPGSNRSTAGYVMNCSIRGASTRAPGSPRHRRGLAGRLQRP